MSRVVELTSELVRRASVTPDDAGCQQFIADRLEPLGFTVRWFPFGDVSNVIITRGEGRPSLWFLGHTDVVPTGPKELWTVPPFEPEVRDGMLYGRGVADMKGAVAAMVVALETFATQQPGHQGQIGLILTSDEEGVAVDGIVRVAEALRASGDYPDHCLVGEPSSQSTLGDTVRIGRRGSIHVRLQVNGIQGHSAFPQLLDNPVHRVSPFLAELVKQTWDEGDHEFPATHCQVAGIRAGTGARNVTPASAEVLVNFRNGPASPSATLQQRFEALMAKHDIRDFDLDWDVSGEPFRSKPGPLRRAVVESLQEMLNVTPEQNTGGGTSDGRFMAPLGTEVIELGLLNKTIHQVDECAAVTDLEHLGAVYYDVLRRLLIS